ncbi:MAG: NusG domain II-containing protein [Bacilli bacterium]|nr:NusG domain II-containing protein [Bacilli bacterium]MBN2877291.1 NusG domain II-containing protein [Bacilli bacterium]
MKKTDLLIILSVLVVGVLSLVGFQIYENQTSTGNQYAQVIYHDQLILMIDLDSNQYILYDTEFMDDIDVTRASEGIYYVPGAITSDMTTLYEVDGYAEENGIVGIKLQVADGKISVVYQESPKDLCQLQAPTNSHLTPIVCLPNELVINVLTNLSSDQFVPDAVLE